VDAVGIGLFEAQLRDNLFKLWNRMSSGSYFPGPVRGVEIPKDHGEGVRLLGVPNTADRVAQTAAAMLLERVLEPVFHRDSYGYRPGRSAHDALAYAAAGAGARTGYWTLISGPFSTPFRIPCC
jgi:RNA-directed DNA polymerase